MARRTRSSPRCRRTAGSAASVRRGWRRTPTRRHRGPSGPPTENGEGRQRGADDKTSVGLVECRVSSLRLKPGRYRLKSGLHKGGLHMRIAARVIAFLALLMGVVWIGQGTGVFPYPQQSFMIDQMPWAYRG